MTILRAIYTVRPVRNHHFIAGRAQIVEEVREGRVPFQLKDLLHLAPSEPKVTSIEKWHAHCVVQEFNERQILSI